MMNKTCYMPKHTGLWSIETLSALSAFAVSYPTSIRGNDNQRGARGTE